MKSWKSIRTTSTNFKYFPLGIFPVHLHIASRKKLIDYSKQWRGGVIKSASKTRLHVEYWSWRISKQPSVVSHLVSPPPPPPLSPGAPFALPVVYTYTEAPAPVCPCVCVCVCVCLRLARPIWKILDQLGEMQCVTEPGLKVFVPALSRVKCGIAKPRRGFDVCLSRWCGPAFADEKCPFHKLWKKAEKVKGEAS